VRGAGAWPLATDRAGYTNQVLQDALVYADHAASRQGGSNVSLDDVQLAIQSRVNYSFLQPPPKEVRVRFAAAA